MKDKWLLRSNIVRGIIFMLLPLIISIMMYSRMVATLHAYMEYQVTVQASALGELASQRISGQLDELSRVAEYYRDDGVAEDVMASSMERLLIDTNWNSCGILRLGGEPLYGAGLRTSEYPAVQRAFRGFSAIRYREGEGLIFTTPVYNGENIKYVLYALCDEKSLFSGFGQSCYNGQAQLLLVDGNQQKIMSIDGGWENAATYFSKGFVQMALDGVKEKLNTGTSAAVLCEYGETKEFLFVSTIGQGNLYVVGKVPYAVVADGVSFLSIMTLLVFGLLLALLCIGTFYVFSVSAKARESDELRAAKQAAEEANQSKSKFIANMTHELRTPINVIMGMDEMILRETAEDTIRERAMDIKSASQILLGLINDVLDFSKIEAGNLNIIPVEYDLVAMIRDLVLLSENRARQKSLNFEMDIQQDLPSGLYGDDIHIRQILVNLLTNAVKYTEEGTVLLKITGKKQNDDTILLHCVVKDTGIGIKEEDLRKLFIPFSRIEERRNRNVEGSGLGLSIIINLLRLMGSDLNVESVYGEGTVFWFDLEQKIINEKPVGDVRKCLDDMVKEYKYQVSFIAPNARILMVDDNSLNRRLFVSLLKNTQIQISTVSSGRKALELVQQEYFDIIFMDYLMPEMDGAETLRRMRELKNNRCQNTPVIALTANAYSGSREVYIEMGFADFLAKPIVTEQLEALIWEKLPKEYIEGVPQKEVSGDRAEDNTVQPQGDGVELPEIEGVQWQHAQLFVQDKKILLSSLKDFYDNIDNVYQEISDLAEEINTEEGLSGYRICVHALKSSAALLGILMVSELSRLLEYAARDGEREKVSAVTPILLEELQKIKERLRPFMEKGKTETEEKPAADAAKLGECFEMLLFSMDQMDIGGADMCMDQIRSYSYDTELQKIVDKVGRKVEALDYKGASEEIELYRSLFGVR